MDIYTQLVAWIATSVAVIAAVYFTKSPWCMWAMIFPFLATV